MHGDEQEKISPLLCLIIDNLKQLIDSSEEERDRDERERQGENDEIISRGFIQAEALNFIRGRSIVKTYLIMAKRSPLCWQITMGAEECERSLPAMDAARRL